MAGSSWPDLIAGRKAKASDVEAKFDWLEGSIVPMTGGSTTSLAHDLGTTTAYWRGLYVGGINPTTTASGVAIGTTTADSSALLDIAGTKALIIPRMTTAQRTALTGANGMMVYDTTLGVFQVYENGAWQGMGSKLGMMPVVYTQTSSPTTQTVLNVQGSGRLRSIILSTVGLGTAINTARVSIVIDSTTTEDIYINTTTTNLAAVVRSGVFGTASSMFASSLTSANDGTATAQSTYNLDAYFKNQLKVHFRSVGSVACDIFVGYETTS